MASTKEIILHGVITDNFHAAFERADEYAATVRDWLARMNAPFYRLSITYEPLCHCGHSGTQHGRICEICDCDGFAADSRFTKGCAFYIGGTEAVPWTALKSLVKALKAVGAIIERAIATDLDSGEDTWKSFKDAA